MLKPTGFWSYSSSDDESSRGRLSQLRARLAAELQQQIGRNEKVNIFQDVAALPPGAAWERQIGEALNDSSFIIPILTPAFLQSEWCCREVMQFRQKEASLGREDLIFPIQYIDVKHVDTDRKEECHDKEVFALLHTRQLVDFRSLRFRDYDSEEVSLKVEVIARAIRESLRDATRQPFQGAIAVGADAGAARDFEPPPPPARDPTPATPPQTATRRERMNITTFVERVAEKYREVNILTFSGVSGFVVDFTSYVARVDDAVLENGKQVGFLWAPNWTVMYVILFPLYNFLFCGIVNRVHDILDVFIESRVITAGGGRRVARDALMADWRQHIGSASATLWMLLAVVTFISAYQWYSDCYLRLVSHDLLGGAPDWSTISIAQKSDVSVGTDIWFSALAYLYMAIALWIYTAVPVYSAFFAEYLRQLSLSTGSFRLVLQPAVFQQEIAGLTRRAFACMFLGLLASYLMQLQAAYLKSPATNILSFMFSGESRLVGGLLHGGLSDAAAATQPLMRVDVTSAFTSWPVAVYALLMFTVYIGLLQNTYSNAKDYYLRHIDVATWREQVGLPYDAREIERIRAQTFLDAVMPTYKHLAVLTAGAVASAVAPRFGTLLVATLCYAAGRVLLLRHRPKVGEGAASLQRI